VLSKCANPECSEQFRFLHQGKLFCLVPTPEVQAMEEGITAALYERFWLCDRCAKTMTLVWGGTRARIVPRPPEPPAMPTVALATTAPNERGKRRAARAASRGR